MSKQKDFCLCRTIVFLFRRSAEARHAVRQYTVVRSSFCFDVSGHAKQCNFLSVVLKINNDQEESVSSAVYKYDTSTNAAFFENFPDDYREVYQCW